MQQILFLTNMEQTATYLQDALKLAQQTQEAVAGQVLYVPSDTEWTRDMEKQLQQAEVVIFPWMGTGLSTKFLSESSSYLLANKKKHVYLMTGNPEDILHGGLSEEELKRINDYYKFGGLQNWTNLWLWLAQQFLQAGCNVPAPELLPWDGIYHPQAAKVYHDVEEYRRDFCKADRPTLAVVFFRSDWLWGNTVFADAVVREIEALGCNALCFFSTSSLDAAIGCGGFKEALSKYVCADGKCYADVFINTIKFSLFSIRACALDDLTKLNITVLQAYTLYRSYQEWYEKILDCDKAIRELTKSQKDLAKAKVERVIEAYDTVIGKRENKADYYKAKQELRISQGYNQKPGSKYEKYMKKELYYTNEQKRLTDKEIKEYKGRMKEYLKVNGHKTVDPEYQKMKKQLYSLQTEAVKLENEAAELVQALQDNREQIKQWAVDRWDRAGSKQDAVIDYAKANDNPEYQINEKIYQERIKSNARQINALQKLRAEKAEYYDIHFSSMNNEEAQKYLDSIAQIDEQILKIGSDIENLKNEIMELRWKPFDDAQDKLSNVITEYQTMQKLLGDAESFYNDDGSFTTNGLTNILLTQESIDATKQKIANYREGLNKLEEQYKNGCYSLDEYNEKSKQLLDGIQQESTALSELKQNMLDMYETQIKKENDLLQENIDKRKNALSAKEKYYDYDKTLKKKSKDINTLKSQIAALEGTSNAAAKARLEKLRAELADAEDDMADTMHQHEVDMKNTGYENFSNEANKALDNTLDAVKKNSSFQEAIISGMLTNVTTNYDNTYKHLHTVMDQYGVKVSSTFDTMIGKSADFNTSLIQQIKALETISNMKVTLPYGTSNGQGGSTTGNNTYTGAENGIHNTFNSNKDSTGAGNETPGTVNGKSYSFSLNKSEIFLTPNESYKLKVTWSPTAPLHSDIKWSSDKTDVAKVSSSGKVTATKGVQTSKGGGVTGILVGGLEKTFKATITAKSDFGSKTCVVHVMPDAHYDAIEEYANKNGLAMTNDKMQAALEYAYRNGGNHADKANIAVEGFKKAYLNDKPTYLKSWFNTLQNRPDGATDVPAGVSPLIGYFNSKGKKVGPKEMQQLADILEISTPGVKKYDSWGSALKNQILQKYKSYGFATGGIINKLIPADMSTLLGKAIISNGDQGFIGAKVGESVMTEEFTRLLKPSIAAMNNFTNMFNPVTPTATNNDYSINNEVNINVANMSNDLDIQDVANKVSTIINKNMTRDWRKLR